MMLVITEAALELVPEKISSHPSILNHAKRRRKTPTSMLLDRSYHHAAMKKMDVAWKRGRPDITYITLLEALGTPLYKRRLVKIFIHTLQDVIIKVSSGVRLPRNYERFLGVFEQLLQVGAAPPTGTPLLKAEKGNLKSLIEREKPSRVIALTTIGKPKPLKKLCEELITIQKPMCLIGGFPKGHFKKENVELADYRFRINKEHLETWVVASRLIHAYELANNILY